MSSHDFDIMDVKAILSVHAAPWAGHSVVRVTSKGTDNALFLLGNAQFLRLPKREDAIAPLKKELVWLPALSGLPLAVPELVFHARSQAELGFEFGIFQWMSGEIAVSECLACSQQAALALAAFLSALHHVDTNGAPLAGPANNNRGIDLALLSDVTRDCIDQLSDEIDVAAARTIWDRACRASKCARAVWLHGDLKADNMIARDGALVGVIDWGLAAVGDPAVDYAAAWTWVDPAARARFQKACAITSDDWDRARGWALYMAVIALSHYRDRSHADLCAQCRRTLDALELQISAR